MTRPDAIRLRFVHWGERTMRKAILTCAVTLVVVASGVIPAIGTVSQVVPSDQGSSNPTYFASNHRIAVTRAGRLLVVHGRHSRGVQLRWKNAGSSTWNEASQGAVSDGMLLDGTGSGDWPSSIVVGRGDDGKERAWVVMGDVNFVGSQPVRMRVLSNLDGAGGPTVGPMVIVDSPTRGAAFVDVALERRAQGGLRGAVVFVRRIDTNSWRLIVTWFTNLETATPGFTGAHVILSSTSGRKQSTLVPTAYGMALLVRAEKGGITMFTHDRTRSLTTWNRAGTGVRAVAQAKPAGTGLPSGDVLMAIEDQVAANHVIVQRFSHGGQVTTMLGMTGYSMPSIASQAKDAWVVMIRDGDGSVVSRHFNPISGWGRIRLEMAAGSDDHHAWPNVLRTGSGFLRFVVRAGQGGPTRSGVKAVERTANAGPDCTKSGGGGNDVLKGTAGRDVLCGKGGNDILIGLGGDDVLIGGRGRDTVRFPGAGSVTVDLAKGVASGRGHDRIYAVENADGGNGSDRISGGRSKNRLAGNGGADVLSGLAAIDVLLGGGGRDTLRGGAGADTVNGGPGVDRCSFEPGGRRISCERPL